MSGIFFLFSFALSPSVFGGMVWDGWYTDYGGGGIPAALMAARDRGLDGGDLDWSFHEGPFALTLHRVDCYFMGHFIPIPKCPNKGLPYLSTSHLG